MEGGKPVSGNLEGPHEKARRAPSAPSFPPSLPLSLPPSLLTTRGNDGRSGDFQGVEQRRPQSGLCPPLPPALPPALPPSLPPALLPFLPPALLPFLPPALLPSLLPQAERASPPLSFPLSLPPSSAGVGWRAMVEVRA
jgi:hypothetical protein